MELRSVCACVCKCVCVFVGAPTLPFWINGSMVSASAPMSTIVPSWNPSVGCGAHTGLPSSMIHFWSARQHNWLREGQKHRHSEGRGKKQNKTCSQNIAIQITLCNFACKLERCLFRYVICLDMLFLNTYTILRGKTTKCKKGTNELSKLQEKNGPFFMLRQEYATLVCFSLVHSLEHFW